MKGKIGFRELQNSNFVSQETVLLGEQAVPLGELRVALIISMIENMKPKITLLISVFISLLLIPSISATQITNVAPTQHATYHKGDPYTTVYLPNEIAPPNGTKPPKIEITSIVNNSVITSNNLTLTFNLIIESPTTYYPIILQGLCYKPSWQSDNITIDFGSNNKFYNKTLPFSISFTNMTDGAKSVTVYASIMYEFETGRENVAEPVSGVKGIPPYGNYLHIYSNYYFIESFSSVEFTIGTAPTITPNINTNSGLDYTTHILLYAIGITILLIVAASLLVYHKKHKTQTKIV